MKKLIVAILVIALVSVILTPAAVAENDKDKPLQAKNVELGKKVTLRGKPIGRGRQVKQTATGVLGEQCSGNKYAIIVGISDYPGEANDLDYADDDAQDVYNALTTLYGYTDDDIYAVSLTVIDSHGCSDTQTRENGITSNGEPTADFSANVTSCCNPLTVQFSDMSMPGDYPIISRYWVFGDGYTSASQNPIHTYDTPGTYTVSLTVTDSHGYSDSKVMENYITSNEGPMADFSASVSPYDPATVLFTDLSTPGDNPIVTWFWDFGDGSNSTVRNPSHIYPDNIQLLLNMDASFNAIRDAIDDIKSKAEAGDEVVFFFSGHGASGKAEDGDKEKIDEAIVSHDGDPSGSLIYIWDGQLRDWFAGFDASRLVFIFDSCYAGGMTDLQAPGRIINMACSERGVAQEGDSWQNGQFTYFFIDEGMLKSEADTYDNVAGDADVTIEEAFDYANDNCRWQRPAISDSFSNDLLP
jgi:PKD repeat protein